MEKTGTITFGGWARLSVSYLVLVALWGTAMRAFPFMDIPFEFRHLLHAHSHVAMLGWVFNMLLLGIVKEFLPPEWKNKSLFRWSFWIVQVSVVGMLVTFSLQGYAFWSILFSTLHILVSYVLIAAIARGTKLFSRKGSLPNLFLAASLFFLFLSSFGPWGLAVTGAKGLSGTPIYKSSIYFFLHFTYNGWITMALLAIWLKSFEKQRAYFHKKGMLWGFWVLAVSILATFLLSLYEFGPGLVWHYLGAAFATVQLLGFMLIISSVKKITGISRWVKWLMVFALSALLGKAVLQIGSCFPALLDLAFFNRDIIVLYLHLVFLGWVSVAIFAYVAHVSVQLPKAFYHGIVVFGTAFALQEVALLFRGMAFFPAAVWEWTLALFIAAVLMLVGAGIMLVSLLGMEKQFLANAN